MLQMRIMEKILTIIVFFLLILFTTNLINLNAENADFPQWVNELQSNIVSVVQTEVNLLTINEPDRFEENEYYVISLEGEGSLNKIPDPFETMEKVFLSNGWKEDPKYAADSHGSSSKAYRKGIQFCITSVQIDSGCDDEETGYIPSKFWFNINCGERSADR